jgi:hydroxymethylbilane synthase
MTHTVLKIGTRASRLALTQAQGVADSIAHLHPSIRVDLVHIQTTGDRVQDRPFEQVGARGMFVRELEEALLRGEIDLAVHSLKDLPGELPLGLSLIPSPPREDPRDALVSHHCTLEQLPEGAVVGTSSTRRSAFLKAGRPDLRLVECRGNVDTRLRKLDEGQYDAIVLAAAGLHRMGLQNRIREYLPPEWMVPAPGQGALGLEICDNNTSVKRLAGAFLTPDWAALLCERAFQHKMEAGCSVPVGCYAQNLNGVLSVTARISTPDGVRSAVVSSKGSSEDPASLGFETAERLWEEFRGLSADTTL